MRRTMPARATSGRRTAGGTSLAAGPVSAAAGTPSTRLRDRTSTHARPALTPPDHPGSRLARRRVKSASHACHDGSKADWARSTGPIWVRPLRRAIKPGFDPADPVRPSDPGTAAPQPPDRSPTGRDRPDRRHPQRPQRPGRRRSTPAPCFARPIQPNPTPTSSRQPQRYATASHRAISASDR
jgi:hypothetical protein